MEYAREEIDIKELALKQKRLTNFVAVYAEYNPTHHEGTSKFQSSMQVYRLYV